MSDIVLSKQEVFDLEEDGNTEEVGERKWRHGTIKSFVFERDGKHYMFEVICHHEEGWQVYEETVAHQVKSIEKTVIIKEWIKI